MPSSLVPAGLAERCWSTELLEALARGEEEELVDADMLAARREVTMTLRKITKETEKMANRFASTMARGRDQTGIQAVWNAFADSTQRRAITSVEAAQYLLGPRADGTLSIVRPNTLPAYAAHDLLMANPRHFLASDRNHWETGQFMIRSREEVDRIARIEGITSPTPVLDDFTRKVKAALAGHSIEWENVERDLLHALVMHLYESRTTQMNPHARIATVILRAIDPYPGETINDQLIARLLQDIGVLPRCDTLTTSKAMEAVCRSMNMRGEVTTETGVPTTTLSDGLLRGDELDALRTDFSSHRVWVIDDASASELDDGISFTRINDSEDVWVHVHVADPTSVIPIDHALARRASYAGSALYLPEGNYPLFPIPDMSRFSLGAADAEGPARTGTGQGVLTMSARVTPSGAFTESKVKLGYIDKARLTTYNLVDQATGRQQTSEAYQPFGTPIAKGTREQLRFVKNAPITDAERDDLDLLFTLARRRKRHRLREAGLEFGSKRGESSLYSSGPIRPLANIFESPAMIPSTTNTLAEDVYINYTVQPGGWAQITAATAVAEMMILAGRICADWCSQRGIAIPYRGGLAPADIASTISRPSMTLAELLARRDENGTVDPMVVRQAGIGFSPGFIDSKPVDHWQLGFVGGDKGYARVTSPLRRFDDFLVHSQIKSYLAQQSSIKWGKLLKSNAMMALAKPSEDAQKRNRLGSAMAQVYWLSQLVRSRLADPSAKGYEGPIVDLAKPMQARVVSLPIQGAVGAGRMDVEVAELQALVEVALGKQAGTFEIGQEVGIRITNAQLRPKALVQGVLV